MIACSITADGIAVSKALNTIPDSTTGDITENSLSCIPAQYAWGQSLVYLVFGLNRTVLLAKVQADVRVLYGQEYDRLERDFVRLSHHKLLPCTKIKTVAEKGRPPFPPNPKTDALVRKAQVIYQQIGLKLGVEGSGGGTDGNYTASVGTTTLDALGPVGGGAHSPDEYIDLNRIAPRIYLLTNLLMKLGASD